MRPKFTLALVTGASSGIGEHFSKFLALQGISLIITARNKEKLEILADSLRKYVDVQVVPCDLSDDKEREHLLQVITERIPDLVINNAAATLYGNFSMHPRLQERKFLRLNVEAVLEITFESAKALMHAEKEGTILNVSSVAAFQVFPLFATYAASKAFINSFSESLDYEMKEKGIRVLCACPGMVDTPFSHHSGGKSIKKRSLLLLSTELVINKMWRQIQKGKRLQIIDWRYGFAVFLTKYILPKTWVAKILESNIRKRIQKSAH